jgi:N-methylhydantoinase B/oxoprolinase/acetone carboxylase alpha subunit
VYEEGPNLPIMKLVERGRMNKWLIGIVAANVREPVGSTSPMMHPTRPNPSSRCSGW